MNKASLTLLQKSLVEIGFQCEGFNEDTFSPKVIIEKDSQGRLWEASLTTYQTPLSANDKTGYFLQVYLPFPYTCVEAATSNTARLLLLLNKGLTFPAFGFSEVDGVIYYLNTTYCENGIIPNTFLVTLISTLALYIDSLSPMIELVSSNQKSMEEVLEMTLKTEKAA